ncbi:sulfite exporter TauE/SafE family protein [Thalassospira lucentensis]|uniref:sulfite exporter TauE/SafE family protein n=1 Tax=Thalassospira lucentensis TaxID=168935 RepID=UPI00142D50A9|nr:sulfite exporter TauE/SafE family protein [Thalassospira lucentensis]NIZ02965.1 sulfite exporter TauE/SafE family protein [Thalassospira lucentensis]
MELFLPGLVVAIAALFRGVTGFGFALLAALGLSSMLPPQTATPIILVIDITITLLILRDFDRTKVDWRACAILLVFGVIGAVIGPYVAAELSDQHARIATNLAIAVAALVAMLHNPPRWMGHFIIGAVLACGVGILMSGFAVGGPLAAAWLLAGGTQDVRVRNTLAIYFGVVDVLGFVTRAGAGMLPDDFIMQVLPLLAVAVLAYFPGEMIYQRISSILWRRICAISLVFIAIVGFAQTVFISF